ncbi:MAG: glycoside hydrolase family 125 protein [Erysipelothrix sp.]|nr:glycoside hydrolase family 125 protein [Erysipelothrix sp.]
MKKLNEVSKPVLDFIEEIKEKTKDHNKWGDIFENVFTNTLETTVKRYEDGDTYVLTGDIPAMWLRDSTAQVRPYLVLANKDKDMADMIKGLVNKQFKFIQHDPYANAFNETFNGAGHQKDNTDLTDLIWERKYEIDSLAYPMQLAYLYYKNTNDSSVFNEEYVKGVKEILRVWTIEQDHKNSSYKFERDTWRLEDTLTHDGYGSPVAYTGMTWSAFNPSDDACKYHYLVPSNMFAVVVLKYLEEVSKDILKDDELYQEARKLREEIDKGIQEFGIVEHKGKKIYAYEVDGLGNYSLKDDPNVPSLLAASYLGYCDFDDEIYQNTREFILSKDNPYYYEGEVAKGCGSSHTPVDYIWPIALSIQGLTDPSKENKKELLDILVRTDGDTLMMHESFNVNNHHLYTREWFSWANMMFCELLLDYLDIKVKI